MQGLLTKKVINSLPAQRPYYLVPVPKQVGLAAWLECWLSHPGVAGSSPGHDNLKKAIRGMNSPCKTVCDRRYKNRQKSVSGRILDILSMVLVRAKSHKGYISERVQSSAG